MDVMLKIIAWVLYKKNVISKLEYEYFDWFIESKRGRKILASDFRQFKDGF